MANEIRLPPPLVMILRELLEDTIENSIARMSSTPPRKNTRIEFGPGVECLPLPTDTLPPSTHTNCYVLGLPGGDRVIIDPAAKCVDGLTQLQEKVDSILKEGSTIVGTIFTHRHQDHIGDLEAISHLYTAPIWGSRETLDSIIIKGETRLLQDGDFFNLDGVIWNVIETPGHCPGQLAFVSEAGIVSADNVAQVGTILVPSGEGDMTAYIRDLKRLRDCKPRLLFPGHGPVVTNPEKLLSHYIRHREKRHEAVFDAWQSGLRDIDDLSRAAYMDTPEAHPLLKLDQTKSHLKALRNEGRI